eukprot:767495-Hanusia_phi.AAC.1
MSRLPWPTQPIGTTQLQIIFLVTAKNLLERGRWFWSLCVAQEQSGLVYEITGKIGIRRKFQTNHIPQLVCLANSRPGRRIQTGKRDVRIPDKSLRTKDKEESGKQSDRKTKEGEGGRKEEVTEAQLDDDGYARHVEAGVTVVSKNVECDILDEVLGVCKGGKS